MIYYRFYLLILICLSYLTCPSLSLANSRFFSFDEMEKKETTLAQGISNDAQPTLSSPPADSAYDQAMQAGYKATEQKDYQAAQTEFQNALKVRPNDIYAQQALQNIEFYLAKQSNPFTNLTASSIGVWIGLLVIVVAIGIGIWLFMRRASAYSQDKLQLEEDLLQPHDFDTVEFDSEVNNDKDLEEIKPTFETDYEDKAEPQPSLFSSETNKIESKSPPEVVVETSDSQGVLSIEKTTRIPSGDLMATLLEELQQTDPKKRRQAIWKLAQTADSRAMKPLVDLMIDTDSQERSLILEALSQISTRTLKPMNHALTLSLQDKNPQVRKNAIRDLTRIHELMSQIYQLLCHAIDDSDREVQETAKWAINQLNTQIPPRLDILTGEGTSEVTVEQSYSDTME
ncbi:MAG: HEAT repeat domain-containing protein [Crocosphaera sp.]|nr:HEAT repeat domain-containing protein [Crocosphaera sp.]